VEALADFVQGFARRTAAPTRAAAVATPGG
jgi:hypothetical protein